MRLEKAQNDVMTGRPSIMIFEETSSMNNKTDFNNFATTQDLVVNEEKKSGGATKSGGVKVTTPSGLVKKKETMPSPKVADDDEP